MKKFAVYMLTLSMLISLPLYGKRKAKGERPSFFKRITQLFVQDNSAKELVDVQMDTMQLEASPEQVEIQERVQEALAPEAKLPEPDTVDEAKELMAQEAPPAPAAPQAAKEQAGEAIAGAGFSDDQEETTEKQTAPEPEDVSRPFAQRKILGTPLTVAPELRFDVDAKREEVVKLVEQGAKALRDNPLDKACNLFSHTKDFVLGELYIFVFDMKGTCLAHGEEADLIWQNLIDLKDWVGTPIVKDILKTARKGGGWVTYGWHNSTKVSYIQKVEKDKRSYAIGCGFFPHSKEEAVVNLVKGGVALFNQIKEANQPIDWAFSRLSYPRGQFVAGNLYLYALDFQGTIVAQGERPGLINTNAWNYRDTNGKYVNREIIQKLKTASNGIWVDYISKRALKKAYAEQVTGPDGKQFFIACGYYPDANRDQVEELVRKGYQFMKSHGKSATIEEFSSRQSNTYRYGDLFLIVYNMKGTVIAHGGNPDQIGINMMSAKDEDGHSFIKDMITRATKTGIWLNAKVKGAFQSTFAAKIDLGLESFVIASSYYPVSKSETMTLLVQSAISFLKDNPRAEAFAQFVDSNGSFRRGDLQIFALDDDGLCFAYGDDYDLIWRNILKLQDDDGRPFIKMFINTAKQGPNFVEVKLNRADKVVYVVPLQKGNKRYVLGSGYYL